MILRHFLRSVSPVELSAKRYSTGIVFCDSSMRLVLFGEFVFLHQLRIEEQVDFIIGICVDGALVGQKTIFN